jgi:hypothetical protein
MTLPHQGGWARPIGSEYYERIVGRDYHTQEDGPTDIFFDRWKLEQSGWFGADQIEFHPDTKEHQSVHRADTQARSNKLFYMGLEILEESQQLRKQAGQLVEKADLLEERAKALLSMSLS